MSQLITWDESTVILFRESLLRWYDETKRLLPWRENTEPYRVWVSEIMLQQTQVVTVIPYYYRFMEMFPTIEDLANAHEDDLLKAWEGLGYYSRVRNMQHAAKDVMERFEGKMPETLEEVMSLKGIGPYTGGAITSIAFNLPEPAVDGNVMRVYSRLFGVTDDIGQVKTRKLFEAQVRETIDPQRPGDFNQALMDLGATVCTPTSPTCETCPLASFCLAKQTDQVALFPVKAKKVKTVPLYYIGLAIQNDKGEYLLEKRPAEGLLANMWTFPMSELPKKEYDQMSLEWQTYKAEQLSAQTSLRVAETLDVKSAFVSHLSQMNGDIVWQKQPLGNISHVFSHRKWFVLLAFGLVKQSAVFSIDENQEWVKLDDFATFAFPKPQQKMVELLMKSNNK